MAMKNYISRGGEQVYAPPFVAEEVQFFGFWVRGTRETIQEKICDRYLNEPLGSGSQRFRPLLSHPLVVFNRIAAMYAKSPPDDIQGHHTEQECGIWLLVYDTETWDVYWYHPYMIVDNAHAFAMGREVYGFPKEYGWFGFTDGPKAPIELTVHTVVTPVRYSKVVRAPLIRAYQTQASVAQTHPAHQKIESAEALAAAIVKGFQVADDLFLEKDLKAESKAALMRKLQNLKLPFLFLKQIRDGVDPTRACFQAIQVTDVAMTRFHSARLYAADYEVEIADHFSHPIREDLGMIGAAPFPASLPFWAKFDFEIRPTKELWRAP